MAKGSGEEREETMVEETTEAMIEERADIGDKMVEERGGSIVVAIGSGEEREETMVEERGERG